MKNAQEKLNDPVTGNFAYVRSYTDGKIHTVLVSQSGAIQEHETFDHGLITQFAERFAGRRNAFEVVWERNASKQKSSLQTASQMESPEKFPLPLRQGKYTLDSQKVKSEFEKKSQNPENASGDLPDGSDGSDGLRFSISEYSAEEVRDYVDILKPFTGTVIDRNPEDYAAYLKEHGVDIPEKDAFRFAQEAAREKMKQARKAADKEAAKQLKLKSLSSILSIWSTRSIKCLSVSNKILTKKDCLIQTVKNPFPHLYQKKRLQIPISQMEKMTTGSIHLR